MVHGLSFQGKPTSGFLGSLTTYSEKNKNVKSKGTPFIFFQKLKTIMEFNSWQNECSKFDPHSPNSMLINLRIP